MSPSYTLLLMALMSDTSGKLALSAVGWVVSMECCSAEAPLWGSGGWMCGFRVGVLLHGRSSFICPTVPIEMQLCYERADNFRGREW